MEREILFKGKKKHDGEWIKGSLVRLESGCLDILPFDTNRSWECHPETIKQYIEIDDIDNQKIFDGDWLSSTYHMDEMEFRHVAYKRNRVIYEDGTWWLTNDDKFKLALKKSIIEFFKLKIVGSVPKEEKDKS